MSQELISVSFCCNDDRGSFAGRVRAVHIDADGDTIELESPYLSESAYNRVFPLIRFEWPQQIYVGHLRLLMVSEKDWHGNIFWHQVTLLRDDVKRLARYLVDVRGFQVCAWPHATDLLPPSFNTQPGAHR